MKQPTSKTMNSRIMLLLLMLLPAMVQAVPWNELDAAEQQVLQPYVKKWDGMSEEQQQRLQRGAKRWSQMNTQERKETTERFQRWQQMTPEQQQRIRKRYRQYLQLDPQQRQRLRQQMEAFRQLPPEEQQALREQWQKQSAVSEDTNNETDTEQNSMSSRQRMDGSAPRMERHGMDHLQRRGR